MVTFGTKSGDEGYTGILGKGKVPKYDLRLEVLGSLDEISAILGLARASAQNSPRCAWLIQIQRHLYQMMSEVAATHENQLRFRVITAEQVNWLDHLVDEVSHSVPIPKDFILPGDSLPGAYLDLARAVTRRAERRMAELVHKGELETPFLLPYLNRLSSLCFVLELQENQANGNAQPTLARDDPNL